MKTCVLFTHIASRLDAAMLEDICEWEAFFESIDQQINRCSNCKFFERVPVDGHPDDFCYYCYQFSSMQNSIGVGEQFDCDFFKKRAVA